MEVKEFQDKILELVSKWDRKRKVMPNEQETFIHFVEEVGELARQYVNLQQRKEKYDEKEVENTIGDALIQLIKLAHLRDLNIEEVILKIIEEDEKRLQG